MTATPELREHLRRIGFQPGQSGNPGGKKPGSENQNVQYWAKKHTREAIATLAGIMRDVKAKDSDRITAANSLLDRGHGKPAVAIDVAVELKKKLSDMSVSELVEFRRKLAESMTAMPLLIEGAVEPIEEPANASD